MCFYVIFPAKGRWRGRGAPYERLQCGVETARAERRTNMRNALSETSEQNVDLLPLVVVIHPISLPSFCASPRTHLRSSFSRPSTLSSPSALANPPRLASVVRLAVVGQSQLMSVLAIMETRIPVDDHRSSVAAAIVPWASVVTNYPSPAVLWRSPSMESRVVILAVAGSVVERSANKWRRGIYCAPGAAGTK